MFLYDDKKRKVIFEDAIRPIIDNLKTSFQANVNLIYNKLVSLGSVPEGKEPSQISNAIQAINDSIYNKLVSLGQTPASKAVEDLNTKIQALTTIQWTQALSIAPVTYTDSEGSHTLVTRDIPINVKDLVNMTISCTILSPALFILDSGHVYWYSANGGLLRSDVIIEAPPSSSAFSKTFTPPGAASYAIIQFNWGGFPFSSVKGNFTLTTRYQTKVLR